MKLSAACVFAFSFGLAAAGPENQLRRRLQATDEEYWTCVCEINHGSSSTEDYKDDYTVDGCYGLLFNDPEADYVGEKSRNVCLQCANDLNKCDNGAGFFCVEEPGFGPKCKFDCDFANENLCPEGTRCLPDPDSIYENGSGCSPDCTIINQQGFCPSSATCMVDEGGPFCQETHDGGMMGDPHVLTWSGRYFDYHGECDLVMAQAVLGQDKKLDLHVRTKIRYQYSYITSAVLRIGDDTLEVSGFGEHFLDGVSSALLESDDDASLGGFPIHYRHDKKHHIFDVVVGPTENVTLSALKDLVSVKVTGGTHEHFKDTTGLMGSFDGTLLARDGETVIEDMNEFGGEWQVRPEEPKLFQSLRSPQLPQQACILPSHLSKEERTRRLGENSVTRDAAEAACAQFKNDDAQFDNCVFDVMAVGDIDVAQAGAY